MPKRKYRDEKSYIKEKIRKLERKLLKKRRNRRLSSSSASDDSVVPENTEEITSVHFTEEPQVDSIELENFDLIDDLYEIEHEQPSTNSAEVEHEQPSTNSASNLPTLDEISLEILGADPSNAVTHGKDIQKDLAVRFEFTATSGLTTERRKELLESHLPPGNCKMIDAPTLNPEIKAAINDNMVKRDKAMMAKQKQIGSAIACLGEAISIILSKDTKDPIILKLLMDTGRILCDSQYNISVTRRQFIMAVLKKDLKDQIQLTKIDNLLFGRELAETLKAAKAINKSGAELKVATTSRHFVNPNKPKLTAPKNNLNWKAPAPYRRPAGPPRAKESAPQMRQPPTHSSRPSRGRPSAARGRP